MERGGMEYNISEFAEWILEAVKEIAAEWMQQYRNRPAMMEELGKVE